MSNMNCNTNSEFDFPDTKKEKSISSLDRNEYTNGNESDTKVPVSSENYIWDNNSMCFNNISSDYSIEKQEEIIQDTPFLPNGGKNQESSN